MEGHVLSHQAGEAKKLGIKTGSRTYEAFQLCPTLLLTPANFIHYWEISKKFITICKDFSPFVEVFSIDELFMDVTLTEHLFGGVIPLITQLKTRIREEIGEYITVSVGIAPNKMLAKMASGLNKPDGIFEITPERLDQVYQIAKLQDVCGIGPRIEKRLNMMGIYTLPKLSRTPLEKLIAEFGNVEGNFLYHVGKGQDASVIHSYTQAPDVKSVGRNYCLPHNEYDKRIVLQNVYELCEEVCIKLRRLRKKARTVGFLLRGTYDIHARKTFHEYFDTGQQLFNACLFILRVNPVQRDESRSNVILEQSRIKDSRFRGNDIEVSSRLREVPDDTSLRSNDNNVIADGYIRQISIWASNLIDNNVVPSSLFPPKMQNPKLTQTIDAINEKFGDHTIRNGFLLYADKLTTVPNGYMADKYERTKLAASSI